MTISQEEIDIDINQTVKLHLDLILQDAELTIDCKKKYVLCCQKYVC